MSDQQKHSQHEISYTVNGEVEKTNEDHLTVRTILTNAGFTPAEEYVLSSENPPRDYGADYEFLVHIHQGQRFQARFKGPTPVS